MALWDAVGVVNLGLTLTPGLDPTVTALPQVSAEDQTIRGQHAMATPVKEGCRHDNNDGPRGAARGLRHRTNFRPPDILRQVYRLLADGEPVSVELLATCPATGRHIRAELTPDRVIRVDPVEAVVSKVRPTEALTDVRAEICNLGHFFSSPEAAADWLKHYPQGQVDPITVEFITRRAMSQLGWTAP